MFTAARSCSTYVEREVIVAIGAYAGRRHDTSRPSPVSRTFRSRPGDNMPVSCAGPHHPPRTSRGMRGYHGGRYEPPHQTGSGRRQFVVVGLHNTPSCSATPHAAHTSTTHRYVHTGNMITHGGRRSVKMADVDILPPPRPCVSMDTARTTWTRAEACSPCRWTPQENPDDFAGRAPPYGERTYHECVCEETGRPASSYGSSACKKKRSRQVSEDVTKKISGFEIVYVR